MFKLVINSKFDLNFVAFAREVFGKNQEDKIKCFIQENIGNPRLQSNIINYKLISHKNEMENFLITLTDNNTYIPQRFTRAIMSFYFKYQNIIISIDNIFPSNNLKRNEDIYMKMKIPTNFNFKPSKSKKQRIDIKYLQEVLNFHTLNKLFIEGKSNHKKLINYMKTFNQLLYVPFKQISFQYLLMNHVEENVKDLHSLVITFLACMRIYLVNIKDIIISTVEKDDINKLSAVIQGLFNKTNLITLFKNKKSISLQKFNINFTEWITSFKSIDNLLSFYLNTINLILEELDNTLSKIDLKELNGYNGKNKDFIKKWEKKLLSGKIKQSRFNNSTESVFIQKIYQKTFKLINVFNFNIKDKIIIDCNFSYFRNLYLSLSKNNVKNLGNYKSINYIRPTNISIANDLINDKILLKDLFSFEINIDELDKSSFYYKLELCISLFKKNSISIEKYLNENSPKNTNIFFIFKINEELNNLAYHFFGDVANIECNGDSNYYSYFELIIEFITLLCEGNSKMKLLLINENNFTKTNKNTENRKFKLSVEKKEKIKNDLLLICESTTVEIENNSKGTKKSFDHCSNHDSLNRIKEDNNRVNSEEELDETNWLKMLNNTENLDNDFLKYFSDISINKSSFKLSLGKDDSSRLILKTEEAFGKNIFETLLFLWIRINRLLILQVNNQEILQYFKIGNYDKILLIINSISRIIFLFFRYSFYEKYNIFTLSPKKIYFFKDLMQIIDILKIIMRDNKVLEITNILAHTIIKSFGIFISIFEINFNINENKRFILSQFSPVEIFDLIVLCFKNCYNKYGGKDKIFLDFKTPINRLELTNLYLTSSAFREDTLFKLSCTLYKFILISTRLNLSAAKNYQCFLEKLIREDVLNNSNFRCEVFRFLNNHIKCIEILYNDVNDQNSKFYVKSYQSKGLNKNSLQSKLITYQTHHITSLLTENDLQNINQNFKLYPTFKRLQNFISMMPQLEDNLRFRFFLFENYKTLYLLSLIEIKDVLKLSSLLSIFINLIILFKYNRRKNNQFAEAIVAFLSLFQIYIIFIFSVIILCIFILKLRKEKKKRILSKILDHLQKNPYFLCLIANLCLGYIAFSTLLKNLYGIQLFTIFFLLPCTKDYINAVFKIHYYLYACLILIVLFILNITAISFSFLKKDYYSDDLNENTCESYFYCFFTILNYGLRSGSIGDFSFIKSIKDDTYYSNFFVSLAFFFLIVLIMSNLINAIIINMCFGYKRLEATKRHLENDICFICSVDSTTLERESLSFEYHVNIHHNIENYIHYMIKCLMEKGSGCIFHDYVANKMQQRNLDFFPRKVVTKI